MLLAVWTVVNLRCVHLHTWGFLHQLVSFLVLSITSDLTWPSILYLSHSMPRVNHCRYVVRQLSLVVLGSILTLRLNNSTSDSFLYYYWTHLCALFPRPFNILLQRDLKRGVGNCLICSSHFIKAGLGDPLLYCRPHREGYSKVLRGSEIPDPNFLTSRDSDPGSMIQRKRGEKNKWKLPFRFSYRNKLNQKGAVNLKNYNKINRFFK
jgi:hypothetical protein